MTKIRQYQDVIGTLFGNTLNEKEKNKINVANITFQVTDNCNLRCTYCYQINKQEHILKLEDAKKFIDMLIANDDNTKKYIDTRSCVGIIIEFIGGEPFLQVKLIDDIVDYFVGQMIIHNHPWQYHYMISICSNGVNYFEPEVQAFIAKHSAHLSFSISIDGNKELHDACRVFPDGRGSYDLAHAGVEDYVSRYGQTMGSKMTLAPDNVMHTYNAAISLIEDGYKEINLNCVYEEGWTIDHAIVLYNQLKQVADYMIDNNLVEKVYLSIFVENFFHPKDENDLQNWCGGDGRMISINWKGEIYPCVRYMEDSLGGDAEPYAIGDLEHGILGTKEFCDRHDCLKCIDRRTQSTDECFYCPIAEGCSWCTAYNYQLNGTPNSRATFICIMHKARALANAYFWNKWYIKQNDTNRMHLYLPDNEALKIISQEELDMLKSLEK